MNEDLRIEIVESAKAYCAGNGMGQDTFAEMSGVNVSYINAMWRGQFVLKGANGKPVQIEDSWFKRVAQTVGFRYEPVYWDFVETDQYLMISTELLDSKNNGNMRMILGGTGFGKSYAVDRFVKEFPVNTYRITVSEVHNLNDIINEMCDFLKIAKTGSLACRMKKMAGKLQSIQLKGGKPILILDEAENMKPRALRMLKGLFDAIRTFCPIVLIGTGKLSDKLDWLEEKDVDGIPQFCRRFRAWKRPIPEIKKEMFAPFLARIEDAGLRTLIESISNNYGELNDYVETSLRDADRLGVCLTEDLFRLMFGMGRRH
jgi:type II secretory pathway predicted ATPase ExeA